MVDKRKDAQIFVAVGMPGIMIAPDSELENELYTMILAGAFKYKMTGDRTDMYGIQISNMNSILLENTVAYNVVLNRTADLKYIGMCSYRRRLDLSPDTDFDKLFKDHDIIVRSRVEVDNMINQYRGLTVDGVRHGHNVQDLMLMIEILLEKHPEYKVVTDKFLVDSDDNYLYPNSVFVMKRDDFVSYYSFFFDLVIEWMSRIGINNEDDMIRHLCDTQDLHNIKYNIAQLAFIQERIFTLWIAYNFNEDRILQMPIIMNGDESISSYNL